MYSLNIVGDDAERALGAAYPDTNELWILERSLGIDPGITDRTASGVMRSNPGMDFDERSAAGDDARPVARALDSAGDRDRVRAHGLEPSVAAARVPAS